jgi:hypothetical protein
MYQLCTPSIIYLIFSITQILIDLYKGLFNTAVMKLIVTIMVTVLLNILCERGLNIISWMIVFIPFILMTVIVSLLLYIFGLNPSKGSLINNNNIITDETGNIIIYDPNFNNIKPPFSYKYPYLTVINPIDSSKTLTQTTPVHSEQSTIIPIGSSDLAYQS